MGINVGKIYGNICLKDKGIKKSNIIIKKHCKALDIWQEHY